MYMDVGCGTLGRTAEEHFVAYEVRYVLVRAIIQDWSGVTRTCYLLLSALALPLSFNSPCTAAQVKRGQAALGRGLLAGTPYFQQRPFFVLSCPGGYKEVTE